MGHRFTYVVSPEEERENLTVEWFLRRHGYSRHIITGLKRTEDGIFRNGVRAWTSQAVHAGDVIETHLVETEPSDGILPRPVPFSVVYEDDDILVVDKPADTPIHPSIGNYENTLANGIAWYFEQKGEPFVYRCINRLDRDTTGLIVLAKHALSAAVLSQAMRSREIHRTYQAFALGETAASGTIDAPIARLNGSLIQRTVDFASGERSVTHYRTLAHCSVFSHLELNLETGRTHQIRVHMASIGCPLAGDPLYGNPRLPASPEIREAINDFGRQALHAAKLALIHPETKKPVGWKTRLPQDMQYLLSVMRDAQQPDDWDDDEEDDLTGWEIIYTQE